MKICNAKDHTLIWKFPIPAIHELNFTHHPNGISIKTSTFFQFLHIQLQIPQTTQTQTIPVSAGIYAGILLGEDVVGHDFLLSAMEFDIGSQVLGLLGLFLGLVELRFQL